MKKNQLLKSVSNVNDAASQVVSPTKGMDGKIKDISVKNGAKNVESIAEKAFKDAITNKTNIDTTNNGQFHTAFNVVDSALTSSVKAGATLNCTTKKIAITLAISLINKYQIGEKREAFSTGDDHVSASTELQTLYAQEKNGDFDRGSNSSVVRLLDENNLDVLYKKIGNASASVDGEFINCDVLDSNILVVNYNGKMIECQLNHSVNSDIINESDINMSTVVVSNHSYNMSATITTVDDNSVLPIASTINVNQKNVNNLVEKNKIRRTNASNNVMNTNMKLLASSDVVKDIKNKGTGLSDDKLQTLKYKLYNKRNKLDNKHKSSKAATDFNRRVRKK